MDSSVDPLSRSVTVRANIPNLDLSLKPGMFLNVALTRDSHEALVVLEAALVPEQSRQFLFVAGGGRGPARSAHRPTQPGRVEVVEGLEVGEVVIVEGTQKVRDGGPVRIVDRQSQQAT